MNDKQESKIKEEQSNGMALEVLKEYISTDCINEIQEKMDK